MSLWDRVKNFINDRIRESPAFEPQAPVEPILPEEPLGGQIEPPFQYDPDQIAIIDDYGIFRGEMTFDEWWQASLLSSEQFHQRFGYDFYTVELIYLLEEYMDIDWDWPTWREQYASANGAAA